ncbi:MAG TPA: DUF3418 domain-containing protein, partial [Polyangiaceae bacterium]|nr:DUF3418 domain-containing protein [Polyangiaceae bacterium]
AVRELRIDPGPRGKRAPGPLGAAQQGKVTPPAPQQGKATPAQRRPGKPQAQAEGDLSAALHRALLSGLLSRIGQYNPEQRNYVGARQTRFLIHPSSALAKKPPAWLMAFELVQTTQLFARTVAKIEPEWLDQVAGHLLKRSYSDPHWSEKAARAKVKVHATLFGLPVLRDYRVDYASVSPVRARLMFLEHALVRGEYASRGSFQEANRALLAEVARLRDKARQSDMLADEDALLGFFDRRVPDFVMDGKSFESWRESAEQQDPQVLRLRLADVLGEAEPLVPEAYPDVLRLHGVELPLSYRFDPSADDDGVTVSLPLALLPQLDPGELDGTIPAWQKSKIVALLESLPKGLRQQLGSSAGLGELVAGELRPFAGPFLPALARVVSLASGVELDERAFRPDAIAGYLRFSFRVLGEQGEVIAQSRDLAQLLQEHGARASAVSKRAVSPAQWERTRLMSWDFDELPEFILRPVQGTKLRSYPAIVDRQSHVDLSLLESAPAADSATRDGVRRLLAFAARSPLEALGKRIPPPFPRQGRMPPSRAESEAFRELVRLRVVRDAFGVSEESMLPRTRTAFESLLRGGLPRVESVFSGLARAMGAAAAELDKLERALDGVTTQPSGTQAARDIRAQLEQLCSADLVKTLELERLEQFPRYLRAAQTRLTRAIHDPRKDADKLAPLAPVWSAFLAKQPSARDQKAAQTLRWAFEELRVAIFAPELKPALSVSLANLSLSVSSLR